MIGCYMTRVFAGERLNRFISKLLDMIRLESGAAQAQLDLVDLSDLVGNALKRADKVLRRRANTISCARWWRTRARF